MSFLKKVPQSPQLPVYCGIDRVFIERVYTKGTIFMTPAVKKYIVKLMLRFIYANSYFDMQKNRIIA